MQACHQGAGQERHNLVFRSLHLKLGEQKMKKKETCCFDVPVFKEKSCGRKRLSAAETTNHLDPFCLSLTLNIHESIVFIRCSPSPPTPSSWHPIPMQRGDVVRAWLCLCNSSLFLAIFFLLEKKQKKNKSFSSNSPQRRALLFL